VVIATTQKDRGVAIQVSNNVGSKRADGTGVGLRNAEARLKYLYGGEATLHFAMTEDDIATARLTLPALHPPDATSGRIQRHTTPEGTDLSCAFSSSTTSL